MSLGETIKITRQRAFYTQEAFAKELNVALSTVNRWEMGKARPNLSAMKNVKDFCKKNELPYDEIEREWLNYSVEEKNYD